jgi:TRAP-type uncharacterized transport system substrate-binding protein
MRQLVLCLLALLLGPGPQPAEAQRSSERARSSSGVVTILTDAIADPRSRGALAVQDMAQRVTASGRIRVLPISGQGGVASVRDLLHLRGVDFALLNSDVLAHLDSLGEHPEARRKIRFVTQVYDQKVYLLVHREISSLDALRGRKLAILSAAGASLVTAQTLFQTLRIGVGLRPLGNETVLDDRAFDGLDGALLLGDELPRLKLTPATLGQLHLLPVPLTGLLKESYRRATLDAAELPGRAEPREIETIAVSTLLAVFDWTPSHARYGDIVDFMNAFFAALPELHRQGSPSPWSEADINAQAPGWTRHAAAQPRRILAPSQLAALSRPERLLDVPQRADTATAVAPIAAAAIATSATEPAPPAPRLAIVALDRPPLADPGARSGGLIATLLLRSLAAIEAGPYARPQVEMRKASAAPLSIDDVLADRTIDVLVPWEGVDCERPADLTLASARLCDDALFSDPLMQVVVGAFHPLERAPASGPAPPLDGLTLCVPSDRDLSAPAPAVRAALAARRLTLVRAPSLLDCIGRAQRSEADGFVANELEGRHLLRRLGISSLFRMSDQPFAVRGVHAVVSKKHPSGEAILAAVNRGIDRLGKSEVYGELIREHLIDSWETPAAGR